MALAALAVLLAAVAAGCGSNSSSSNASTSSSSGGSTQSIPIGAVCDLSGAFKAFGNTCKGALTMAVDDFNSQGGATVNGKKYKFNLEVSDGGSDPAKAVAATRSFLSKGTKFLFGPDTSPTALQMAAVTKNADVIQIGSASALHAALGQGKNQIFDTVPQDKNWVGNIVNDLQMMGINSGKVVISYPDDQTGQAVVPNVTKILESAGYQVGTAMFSSDSLDFRSVATKVKSLHPAATMIGYTLTSNLPLTRALVQLQATPAIVAVNSTPYEVPKVIEKETGKTFPLKWGTIGVGPNFSQPTSPAVAQFAAKVKSKIGLDPHTTAATLATWWYDYVFLLGRAMGKAGTTTDTAKVTQALRTETCSNCVLKDLHFDPDQSANFASDAGVYINGKQKWKSITPGS